MIKKCVQFNMHVFSKTLTFVHNFSRVCALSWDYGSRSSTFIASACMHTCMRIDSMWQSHCHSRLYCSKDFRRTAAWTDTTFKKILATCCMDKEITWVRFVAIWDSSPHLMVIPASWWKLVLGICNYFFTFSFLTAFSFCLVRDTLYY